jgi:hypothetical protein
MNYFLIKIALIILVLSFQLRANPIAIPYISELRTDQNGFAIEIDAENFLDVSLDGWFVF